MLLLALLLAAGMPPAALPTSTPAPPGVDAIPMFARYAQAQDTPDYTVPVHVSASFHVLFFSFPFRRRGSVSFTAPDSLSVSIDSVAAKYTKVFNEMGTPQTWLRQFDLHLVDAEPVDGHPGFRIEGTPKEASDIDRVVIRLSTQDAPIYAQWFLHDGYRIDTTLEMEEVDGHCVPAHEQAEITGHGYRIHSDMTYGSYAFKPIATATR